MIPSKDLQGGSSGGEQRLSTQHPYKQLDLKSVASKEQILNNVSSSIQLSDRPSLDPKQSKEAGSKFKKSAVQSKKNSIVGLSSAEK